MTRPAPGTLIPIGREPNQGDKIITPGVSNITIPRGWHEGNGYVKGDANLLAENIADGVEIFGVEGEAETYKNILFLPDKGVEWQAGGQVGTPTPTYYIDDNGLVMHNNKDIVGIVTKDLITFDDINEIVFYYDVWTTGGTVNTQQLYFTVLNNKTDTYTNSVDQDYILNVPSGCYKFIYDVSDITGDYYLGVQHRSSYASPVSFYIAFSMIAYG